MEVPPARQAKILKVLKNLSLTALVVLALSLLSLRLLSHNLALILPLLQQQLHQQGISLEAQTIQTNWYGWQPALKAFNVELELPDHPSVQVTSVEVLFLPSVLWRPGLEAIADVQLKLDKVQIDRQSDGQWNINGVAVAAQGDGQGFELGHLPSIHVQLQHLQLRDAISQSESEWQNLSLDARHQAGRLQLQFEANQVQKPSSHLELRAVATGTAMNYKLWEWQIFAETRALPLELLANWLEPVANVSMSGSLDLQLWAKRSGQRWQQINLDLNFDAENLSWKSNARELPALQIASRWQLRQSSEQTWEVWLADGSWQSEKLHQEQLQLYGQWDGTQQLSRLWLARLDQQLGQLMQPWLAAPMAEAWQAMAPQFVLNNLVLEHQGDWRDWYQIAASVELNQWSNLAWQQIPGIEHLQLELVANQGLFAADLDLSAGRVDLPELLRQPIGLDSLQARLEASVAKDFQSAYLWLPRISIQNQDVTAQARLQLDLLPEHPRLYVRAASEQADLSNLSAYLPTPYMEPDLVLWLDQGIKAGQVQGADLLYHATLQSFKTMHAEQSGRFESRISANDATVMFDKHWKAAHKVQAEAYFHDIGMQIKAPVAVIDGIEASDISVTIDNFFDTDLQIKASATESLSKARRFLRQSPLYRYYRDIDSVVQDRGGQVSIDLQIGMALGKSGHLNHNFGVPRVKGDIHLSDVSLQAQDWKLDLQKVNGLVQFEDLDISAEHLALELWGQPHQVSIKTLPGQQKNLPTVQILSEGRTPLRPFMQDLPNFVPESITGLSHWHTEAELFPKPGQLLQIHARSDLEGTGFSFPQPLDKPSTSVEPLDWKMQLFEDGQMQYELHWSDRLQSQGRLQLWNHPDASPLVAAHVLLGQGKTRLPQQGLTLSGQIGTISLSEWQAYLAGSTSSQATAHSPFKQINRVHLKATQLELLGQELKPFQLQADRYRDVLVGWLKSEVLQGKFIVPDQPANETPVVLDLDYLRWRSKSTTEQSQNQIQDRADAQKSVKAAKPEDFLPVKITAKSLNLDDRNFNNLELLTETATNSYQIKRLNINVANAQLKMHGGWYFDVNTQSHHTQLFFNTSADNLGEVLERLQFGKVMHKGTLNFDADLRWAAPLTQVNWQNLMGSGHFDLKNGTVLAAQPGAGRLVGLFSLSALPRRLTLDFKDVSEDGLQYDKLSGNLKLAKGVLETLDTELEGPAVRVYVGGHIDLQHQSYQEVITVIPRVRDTLPLLGAAASSQLGWALLLLQKMFEKPIEESVKLQYTLTGSWDNPKLEPLNTSTQKTQIQQ